VATGVKWGGAMTTGAFYMLELNRGRSQPEGCVPNPILPSLGSAPHYTGTTRRDNVAKDRNETLPEEEAALCISLE